MSKLTVKTIEITITSLASGRLGHPLPTWQKARLKTVYKTILGLKFKVARYLVYSYHESWDEWRGPSSTYIRTYSRVKT